MNSPRRSIEERLYSLLPALHRIRDDAQGEPLRALLAILEHELLAVRDDTQGLYDDWFIETCSEWVVPYIGDLLGVELMRSSEAEGFSRRGYIANTLSYRRRKGTAAVIEQLARDVTGWPARAVEYFERLCTSQHSQHIRLHAPATISLRDSNALELVGGPFGDDCRTGEVRLITSRRGRFNIPNIGVHLWRLRPYPLKRVEARAFAGDGAPGRYHFSPLGVRAPLFNVPRSEVELVHLAEERDVPARLRRRALYAELKPVVERGETPPADGWFGEQPVLRVFRIAGGVEKEIVPPQLRICNLDVGDDPATTWPRPKDAGHVHVDPESGRLVFPESSVEATPETVLVDYAYGFSGDLGGGPYDRRASVGDRFDVPESGAGGVHHGVSRDHKALGDEVIHASLAAAIERWNVDALEAWADGRALTRVISVMDSRTYEGALTLANRGCVVMPPGSQLRIVAARWPTEIDDPVAGSEKRTAGRLDPTDVRPHVLGDLEVLGLADPTGADWAGRLELDGLLIEGAITVLPGALGALAIRHCTLVPGLGGLRIDSTESLTSSTSALTTNSGLELELTRSIVDGISLTGSIGSLRVTNCIVDTGGMRRAVSGHELVKFVESELGEALSPQLNTATNAALADADIELVTITWTETNGYSLAGDGANADIRLSTLLGRLELRALEGSESLFVGEIEARVVQEGCLRYSYSTPTSRTPQRFRCQPDLAVAAAKTAAKDGGKKPEDVDLKQVNERVRPFFTSTTYGHAAYCQLARSAAAELTTGAEDGSEMGAFSMLKQAHRESNLHAALEQYLRFGLDAGVFYAT